MHNPLSLGLLGRTLYMKKDPFTSQIYERGNCSVCCRDEVLICQKQFNDDAHETLTCVQFSSVLQFCLVNRKEENCRKLLQFCIEYAIALAS